MIFIESSRFTKDFEQLSASQKESVSYVLELFKEDPYNPRLRNHKLQGILKGHFSLKAGYDLRVICRYENNKVYVLLVSVGRHEDVY